jgi:alkylation response protein AidB-like acyl-CoA dehydrogenase
MMKTTAIRDAEYWTVNGRKAFITGAHATVIIENLRIPAEQMLGNSGEGFKYARMRLAPARLSH